MKICGVRYQLKINMGTFINKTCSKKISMTLFNFYHFCIVKGIQLSFLKLRFRMNLYGSLAALIDQSVLSLGRCGETVSRGGTDVSDGG